MKKLLNAITITAAILILTAQITSAETMDGPELADILPNTVDIMYEFDTGVTNPLTDFIVEELKYDFYLFKGTDEGVTAIEEVFTDNTLMLAIDMTEGMDLIYDDPNMYASFHITEEEFTNLMEFALEEPVTEEYESYTLYTTEVDTHFVLIDGLLVVSNTIESIKGLVDNYVNDETATLANNPVYLHSLAYETENPFLSMYVDPSFVTNEIFDTYDPMTGTGIFDPTGMDPELLGALKGEGISISQVDNGFDFGIYVEGDETKLTELDMLFDKYNFVPELYDYISGNDIIFYSEQFNVAGSMEDTLRVFDTTGESEFKEIYEMFAQWFDESTLTSFENDFLPMLNGPNLIAVHNSGQIFPAVTIIVETRDRGETIDILSTLNQNLRENWEALEVAEGTEFYEFSVERVGSAAFYQHKIDLATLTQDEELLSLPPELTVLTFRFSVASNAQLVVSTHPDLETVYGSQYSMTDNASFAEQYTFAGEESAGISYINLQNATAYIEILMNSLEASEEDINFMKDIMAPWNDMFIASYATPDKGWAYGTVNVDVDALATYGEVFEEFFAYDYVYPDNLLLFDMDYCDVDINDWYFDYIEKLNSVGIISGYEDGCFRPDNEVTRAEFTKMMLGGAEWSGLYIPVAMSDADIYFDDVPSSEWYWYDISQAAANGFVDGYEDGTFQPNNPISRAEALQILYNISPFIQSYPSDEPFEDVLDEDWFRDAVGTNYNADIVSGTTPDTFEPNRNITRAEAAKIVSEFMERHMPTPIEML